MRLVSWNLRFDSKPDTISVQETLESLRGPLEVPPFMGKKREQPWSVRRIPVAQQLLSEGVVLAGFQEALIRQVKDLHELLGSEWSWIGAGRDDGQMAGEFNPIFYNNRKLALIDNERFWLSETPFKPSRYPGAGSYRIAEVATFAIGGDKTKTFTFINTHLDERSEAQRKLGASLLLHRCRYAAKTLAPVFVVGDFNRRVHGPLFGGNFGSLTDSAQSGSDSGAYKVLTGALNPVPIPDDFRTTYTISDNDYPDFAMKDLRAETPRLGVMGHFRTFTGFDQPLGQDEYARIDYVLAGSNGGWTSHRYNTTSMVTDDGVMASDHRPVFVDIEIGTE